MTNNVNLQRWIQGPYSIHLGDHGTVQEMVAFKTYAVLEELLVFDACYTRQGCKKHITTSMI